MKNKKNNTLLFVIFSLLIILIIILFAFFLKRVISNSSKKYDISTNTLLISDSGDMFQPESESKLSLNWNNNYYLHSNLEKEKIGKSVISYNLKNFVLNFYGTIYKVNLNGEVEIKKDFTELTSSEPAFYKIDDRKYLFVDSTMISDDSETVLASKFLFIQVDKKGNAYFLNNLINVKTINPMVINGTKFSFDIANELLVVNDKNINLKNIIGSTNEYVKESESADPMDGVDYLTDSFNKYMNELAGANDNIVNNITNNNGVDLKDLNYSRWVNLTSVDTTVTSINVNYLVFDPYNDYTDIFLTYVETGTENYNTISLSKENTSYVIYGLKPLTQYTITLNYSYQGVNQVSDSLVVKTDNPKYEIVVDKVDYFNKIVYFTIKSNNQIIFDSFDLSFNSGETNIIRNYMYEQSDERNKASTIEGYSSSFDYSGKDVSGFVTLKMDNIYYNGHLLEFEYQSKFLVN